MINGAKWWIWKGDVSKKICEKIIKLGKSKKSTKGFLGKDTYDPIKRKSSLVWLSDQKIFDLMSYYINLANKNAGWNVEISRMEDVQFTNYDKKGHYDWHVDCADEPFAEDAHENFRGKIRKLSCIINLSDGDKFEGGDLFIAQDQSASPERKINRITELRKQGSVIVFPSYTHHKVSPVKKGKRHSLVAWSIGQPWK
jgi:PKHD-type hydroxylase|tara:strand:- start:2739 stop:3332 length:594 start_codon:yes stop_codon:yes gene_type:complete